MRLGLMVRVTQRKSDYSIHGDPIALSEGLLLIHVIDEVHYDGYCVVPLSTVERVRSGRFERAFERVFDALCPQRRATAPAGIEISSPVSLFAGLRASQRYVIIETAALDARARRGEKTFYIGPIVGLADDAVAVHSFNAVGRWDRRPTRVRYDRISRMRFDCEYINAWSKFLTRTRPARGRG